jgi:hypothetical protein
MNFRFLLLSELCCAQQIILKLAFVEVPPPQKQALEQTLPINPTTVPRSRAQFGLLLPKQLRLLLPPASQTPAPDCPGF